MKVRNVVYFLRGTEQAPILELSIESVLRSNPEAVIYVMAEDCPPLLQRFDLGPLESVRWWPCNYGTPLMVANLQAQCEFLVSARHDRGATAFLDCDTLVLQQLVGIPNADLVVTYRDHVSVKNGQKIEGLAKLMPFNYGVLFAADTMSAKEAFWWMRERVRRYHRPLQDWYGNQRALAELAGPAPASPMTQRRPLRQPIQPLEFDDAPGQLPRCTDISVAYVPGDQWNYTPESVDEELGAKKILHFKGDRKAMMDAMVDKLRNTLWR